MFSASYGAPCQHSRLLRTAVPEAQALAARLDALILDLFPELVQARWVCGSTAACGLQQGAHAKPRSLQRSDASSSLYMCLLSRFIRDDQRAYGYDEDRAVPSTCRVGLVEPRLLENIQPILHELYKVNTAVSVPGLATGRVHAWATGPPRA